MRTHRYTLVALLVLAAPVFAADPPKKITYDDHVLPILKDKCIACHNLDRMSGGLVLNSYSALMEGGASGEVVKGGDPDGSRLLLTMTHKVQPFMPPKSPPLPKETLDVIRAWIAGGVLENSGSVAKINKPKVDITLSSVVKGKPEGPPPMPEKALSLDPIVRVPRTTAVTALASNPWSPLVAVAGQKQVLLYNGDTQDLLGVLPFPEGTIHVLTFSRNGSLLLAAGGQGGKSGRAVVWGVKTGERIFEVGDEADAILAADISADQTQIAVGGPSKVVRVYSTKDGSVLREIRKHTDWIYSLEYSPDGVLLATGDRNGGLFVWEAYTGREYFSLRGHTAAVTGVSWRADSNVLASCSEDSTVRLWEMENGGQVRNWGAHGGGSLSVRYGHDGRLTTAGRDRVVKVWDGNGAQQRAFEAFPDVALRSTFTHDGQRVIAGDWTGSVRVFATADGKPLGTLSTNPPSVAERLDAATKEVAAKEAAHQQLVAAAVASQEAATKAAAELTAAQQAVLTTAAAAKAAADALPAVKAAVDQANANLTTAQTTVAAKDVTAKVYAEAAVKIKAEADRLKTPALAAEATKAQQIATQATSELATAQKAVVDLTAAAKTANDQYVAAQKLAADTATAAANAPKVVEAKTPVAKAAADKAATDQNAVKASEAALAAAKAQLERLKATVAVAKQPG